MFSPPPIVVFSFGAQIIPPLVQLIGHVSALRGHPLKTLNFDYPLPERTCTLSNTLSSFVRTHFQY